MKKFFIIFIVISYGYSFHFDDVKSRSSFVSDRGEFSTVFINPSFLALQDNYIAMDVETPYNMVDGLKLVRGSGSIDTRIGGFGIGFYSLGNSLASENMLRFAHGFFIKDTVLFGYSVNLLNCTYRNSGSYYSYSIDISLSTIFYSRFSFAFQFRNVNRASIGDVRLPSTISAAISYNTDDYTTSFEIEKTENYETSFRTKFRLKEPLIIDIYLSSYPVEIGTGAGFNIKRISILYTAVYNINLPLSHKFQILYRL